MAALVVVLLLALLGTWAWQTLSRAGQEPGSEAPEIASAGSTGSEETAAEEGSTGGTEEQVVVSQQGPSERLESSIRASTPEGRVIGSSNVAGVTAAMVSPVTSVQPVLPAATRPAVLPATGSGPEPPRALHRLPMFLPVTRRRWFNRFPLKSRPPSWGQKPLRKRLPLRKLASRTRVLAAAQPQRREVQ